MNSDLKTLAIVTHLANFFQAALEAGYSEEAASALVRTYQLGTYATPERWEADAPDFGLGPWDC